MNKYSYKPSSIGWIIIFLLLANFFLMELKTPARSFLFPFGPYISFLIQVGVLFLTIFMFSREFRIDFCSGWFFALMISMLGLFSLSLMSGIWSRHPTLTLARAVITFLPVFLIFFVLFADQRPLDLFVKFSYFFVVVVFFLSLISVVLYFFGALIEKPIKIQQICMGPTCISQRVYGREPFLRASSLFGNPNSFAGVLIFATPLLIFLKRIYFFTTKEFFLYGSVIFFGLLITFSRTGFTVVFLSSLIYLFFSMKKTYSRVLFFVLSLLLVFFILMGVVVLQDFYDSERFVFDLNDRDNAWLPLVESVRNNFLLGVGFGVSSESILSVQGVEISGHNAHLQLLSELGMLGYIGFTFFWLPAFLMVLVKLLRDRLEKNIREILSVSSAIVISVMIHQMFEGSLLRYSYLTILWFFIFFLMVRVGFSKRVIVNSSGQRT